MKVKEAFLGSPSQINLMVFVDTKHHERKKEESSLKQSVYLVCCLGVCLNSLFSIQDA